MSAVSPWLARRALAVALILCAVPCIASAQAAQAQWSGVARVVAFADVHGAFDELTVLLREAGIIDGENRWIGGRTHVVSLGDLLDRGADSRKVMDLLMRLQGEAAAAGGALHVVLGNHEAMNLLGHLRDALPAELASYADLERAEERAVERARWIEQSGPDSGESFDKLFPTGFFGHRAALSPDGSYGRWLLGLPVTIVVNDTLFVHGGLSPVLRGMSAGELNRRYTQALRDYLSSLRELEQAGLVRSGDKFEDRAQLAAQRLAATPGAAPNPALADALKRFEQADRSPLLEPDGPNWYRGTALCREATEADVLLPLLEQFSASRVVVGHTVSRTFRVGTRFDGRVIKLDTGMNRAVYKGRPAALTIEGSRLEVRYAGEPQLTPLSPEGVFVAPNSLEEQVVLAALRDGQVTVAQPRSPGELDVVVEHAGRRFPAVFIARSETASRRELAAFRLDRAVGFGIVPATAEREVQGQRGVLQARPARWVTQADVQRQSLRGGGSCAFEPQFQLVYAFDALLGNDVRTPESLLFDARDWYVYATGHDAAFGTGRGLPSYLKAKPPTIGPELRRRLAALDQEKLAAALGDLVDERGRKALLQRRDGLLALPSAATGVAR